VALAEINNGGTISAEGGNLLVYGSIDGTGTLGVGNNATLTLQAAVDPGQTLTFGNNSKLVLNDARAFHGTITGFGSDDVLDLSGIQATNPNYANGTLTLDTPSGQLVLIFAGPYGANAFSVRPDGFGGTLVSGGFGDVHIVSLDGFAYDFQARSSPRAAMAAATSGRSRSRPTASTAPRAGRPGSPPSSATPP